MPSTATSLSSAAGTETTMNDITVSGTLIDGLRADCRILQTTDRRWSLSGPGTEELREGQQVTVTGQAAAGAKSMCGPPLFVVSKIH